MSELRALEGLDVGAFLENLTNAGRREDAKTLVGIMRSVTACPARMWGGSIIGFDRYEYRQKNGTKAAAMVTGFAPRKANMVVYIMPGFSGYEDLLGKLGPHKHTVCCLYLGRLATIDLGVLEQIIASSVADMRKKYS